MIGGARAAPPVAARPRPALIATGLVALGVALGASGCGEETQTPPAEDSTSVQGAAPTEPATADVGGAQKPDRGGKGDGEGGGGGSEQSAAGAGADHGSPHAGRDAGGRSTASGEAQSPAPEATAGGSGATGNGGGGGSRGHGQNGGSGSHIHTTPGQPPSPGGDVAPAPVQGSQAGTPNKPPDPSGPTAESPGQAPATPATPPSPKSTKAGNYPEPGGRRRVPR